MSKVCFNDKKSPCEKYIVEIFANDRYLYKYVSQEIN